MRRFTGYRFKNFVDGNLWTKAEKTYINNLELIRLVKRNNIITIVFVIIVVGFIGGAIYYLNSENDEYVLDEEVVVTQTEEISVVSNMKMAIASYDTMNPIITHNRDIIQIDKFIFEPLVNLTPDYKIKYDLAKSITKDDDLTYTVKVNNNIIFQNGSKLLAKDVEFTILRLKEANTTYSRNVEPIASIEVKDEETIVLHLVHPVTFFEYNLTFPILCASYYDGENFFNTAKIPIGTGMYKIASIDSSSVFLTRNERWKDFKTNAPKTESITIKLYGAIGEAFNSFKLGGMDIINTKMPNYADYIGTMGYNKKEYIGREYDFISLNCNDYILNDARVRRAISYGIIKKEVVSNALGNRKVIANTPLDYGSFYSTNENLCTENYELARKELTEAGWTDNGGYWSKDIDGRATRLQISLVVNNSSQDRINVAYNIKGQLANIGVIVNITLVNDDSYFAYLNNKNYQMILTGVTNSVNPSLGYFYGDGNIANYNNEEVKNSLGNLDTLQKCIKIANSECPYIGLYRDKGTIVLNPNVGGEFNITSFNIYNAFYNWYRQR